MFTLQQMKAVHGYYGKLDQTIPGALEHRVVLIEREIIINTQEVDMVKVFRKCLSVVFGMRWSMAPECPPGCLVLVLLVVFE